MALSDGQKRVGSHKFSHIHYIKRKLCSDEITLRGTKIKVSGGHFKGLTGFCSKTYLHFSPFQSHIYQEHQGGRFFRANQRVVYG